MEQKYSEERKHNYVWGVYEKDNSRNFLGLRGKGEEETDNFSLTKLVSFFNSSKSSEKTSSAISTGFTGSTNSTVESLSDCLRRSSEQLENHNSQVMRKLEGILDEIQSKYDKYHIHEGYAFFYNLEDLAKFKAYVTPLYGRFYSELRNLLTCNGNPVEEHSYIYGLYGVTLSEYKPKKSMDLLLDSIPELKKWIEYRSELFHKLKAIHKLNLHTQTHQPTFEKQYYESLMFIDGQLNFLRRLEPNNPGIKKDRDDRIRKLNIEKQYLRKVSELLFKIQTREKIINRLLVYAKQCVEYLVDVDKETFPITPGDGTSYYKIQTRFNDEGVEQILPVKLSGNSDKDMINLRRFYDLVSVDIISVDYEGRENICHAYFGLRGVLKQLSTKMLFNAPNKDSVSAKELDEHNFRLFIKRMTEQESKAYLTYERKKCYFNCSMYLDYLRDLCKAVEQFDTDSEEKESVLKKYKELEERISQRLDKAYRDEIHIPLTILK